MHESTLSPGRVTVLMELVRLNVRNRVLTKAQAADEAQAQRVVDMVEYDMLLIMALPDAANRNHARAIITDTASTVLADILGA